MQKPRLFLFSFLTKDQTSFKKQEFHALFFRMACSKEIEYNIIFMYDTYTYHMYNYDITCNVEFLI